MTKNEKIMLLRHQIEQLVNQCQTGRDLVKAAKPVCCLLDKIEKLL